MPAIHFDTNFLILAVSRGTMEARKTSRWLASRYQIHVSAVAWTEFQCGPVSEEAINAAALLTGKPIAFDALDAITAAGLFDFGGRRRSSTVDCMIAAVAIRAGAFLATNNRQDFERFVPFGLSLDTP
ncbi:MAG: PIN domain-containing protein [Gemmatimonadota bacterium]|nr:PIN domain-containing protein [Gemmatimonadota bacterium]